jgi:transcriptional regulator
MRADALHGHLDMLVLAILEEGPRHGYAVIEELRLRSDEAIDLPEGTVYPALHRLERAGLLKSKWSDIGGRRRRTYMLTSAGRKAVGQKRQDWAAFASVVQRVLETEAWPNPS